MAYINICSNDTDTINYWSGDVFIKEYIFWFQRVVICLVTLFSSSIIISLFEIHQCQNVSRLSAVALRAYTLAICEASIWDVASLSFRVPWDYCFSRLRVPSSKFGWICFKEMEVYVTHPFLHPFDIMSHNVQLKHLQSVNNHICDTDSQREMRLTDIHIIPIC